MPAGSLTPRSSAMPSSDGPPLNERSLLTVTSLGHTICHVGELVFVGVMLAVQKEFALESWQAAALAGPGYLLMGVGALPVGVLADWWGPTRVFQLYFIGMAVGGLLVAVSTTVWQLLAALTFLGLAASIYHPVGLALLSLGTGSRGRAMGINGVAGSVGVACGPLLGAAFAALGQWRLAFVALAVLSLITGAYLLLVQRRINLDRLTAPDRPGPTSVRPFDWRRSLPMILVSATMLLGGFNYRCLLTALPVYLGGDAAGEVFRGGVAMFLVLLVGGCVGQYLGGWAVDRFGAVVYPAFTALLVPLALLLAAFSGWGAAALL